MMVFSVKIVGKAKVAPKMDTQSQDWNYVQLYLKQTFMRLFQKIVDSVLKKQSSTLTAKLCLVIYKTRPADFIRTLVIEWTRF